MSRVFSAIVLSGLLFSQFAVVVSPPLEDIAIEHVKGK